MRYKGLVVAVDFDGTITDKNQFPKIGNIRPYAAEVIRKLQEEGATICLWTCRCDNSLRDAINFLNENEIYPDYYNEGPSTGSPKIVANVYIDDAAYPNNGNIDWKEVAKYFDISI